MNITEIPKYDINNGEWTFLIRKIDTNYSDYDESLPHKHNFYQFFYFKNANGIHLIDNKKFKVTNNSIHFISDNQVHYLELDDGSTGYVCMFKKEFFSSQITDIQIIKSSKTLGLNKIESNINFNKEQNNELTNILDLMYEEFICKKENYLNILQLFTSTLVLKCDRLIIKKTEIKASTKRSKHIFSDFIDLVNLHYNDKKTVSHYAELLNISPTYLNRIIKKTCDKTATELIIERKLVEAKRLLHNTDVTVNEISHLISFESPSYFIKIFKKKVGLTPSKFRFSS